MGTLCSRTALRYRQSLVWLFVIGLVLLASPDLLAQTPDTTQDRLIQTYTFPAPTLQDFDLWGQAFTSIAMPGSLNLARKAGEPALPVRFAKVLLPAGKEVLRVRVEGELKKYEPESRDLKLRPLFPYQKPVPIGYKAPEEIVRDETLYASEELFPSSHHACERTGFCRGYAIFSTALSPVKYSPARGELYYFTEMTLTLDLRDAEHANPLLRPGNNEDAAWVKNLVDNPAAAATYNTTSGLVSDYPGGLCDPADDYDYVIITTTHGGLDYWLTTGSIPYNWESLMNKHAVDDGLSCTLVTIQDIVAQADYQNANPLFNDTPARIREFCKDAYMDWGTQYILVGGDDEWIPAREMDSSVEGDVDADIYWNHLDGTFNDDGDSSWGEEGDSGFDLYADLFIGRVTCDEPQDVSNWLKKSFVYTDSTDRDYLDNAAFYGGDTTWNCQGDDFVDYSAIKGTSSWLGPNPDLDPYPAWLGFQYGFETWNQENPGAEYDMSVKWTAEPPNPGGWQGGSESAAINGLMNAINNDQCTLIAAIAHANEYMSMDVQNTAWEANYHNTLPFFLHDYGCHCGDMDAADDGVLHSMLFHSDTELAFACVYNTGYGWGNYDNTCSSSSLQQKSFFDYLFDVGSHSGGCDNWQMGKAQAYTKDLMAPTIDYDGTYRSVIQCCLLFGDPAQKIRPPEEPILYMAFPEGLPASQQPPGPAVNLTIQISDALETYVPGTAKVHYRFDPADPFAEILLDDLGGGLFGVDLPNTAPGDEPVFYFSAQASGGGTVYSPWNAPVQTYGFEVYLVQVVFEDDFETDKGWTVENIALEDGPWERGVPAGLGERGDPPTDYDGSGSCFVTDNVYGNSDVDGGPTILTSPAIDLSSGDAQIGYYRWHYCDDGDDLMTVEVSNNNGNTWYRVEQVTPSGGWNYHAFNVADKVTPTAQVKIRFSSVDNPNDSVTESGLDAFQVRRILNDPTLWVDTYSFSVAVGGEVGLFLGAGAANSGRQYLVLASFSGSEPGLPLPGGTVFPLNWDNFTDWTLAHLGMPVCTNFIGYLDGQGKATALFDTGGPVASKFIGRTLTFAYLLEPTPDWDFVSNAIDVTIEP